MDRHRLMTFEQRLPSMHGAVGSPANGRGSTPLTPWAGCKHLLLSQSTKRKHELQLFKHYLPQQPSDENQLNHIRGDRHTGARADENCPEVDAD